jgi:hypothetical protein
MDMSEWKSMVEMLRFHGAYWVLRAGLWIMPRGRAKSELMALLWTWNLRVQAVLAAAQAKKIGATDIV